MAVGTQHHERALVRMPTMPARASERLRIKLPIFLVLLAIAASTVYPLLFLALNALKERTDYYANAYGLPREHFSEADWYGLLDGYRQSAGYPTVAT